MSILSFKKKKIAYIFKWLNTIETQFFRFIFFASRGFLKNLIKLWIQYLGNKIIRTGFFILCIKNDILFAQKPSLSTATRNYESLINFLNVDYLFCVFPVDV